VPDPRRARGRRYPWPLPLAPIAVAKASGVCNVRASGLWVGERAEELCPLLEPERGRLPGTATLRRAVRAVDVAALEDRLAASWPAPGHRRPPPAIIPRR
jgi:DDE_Tnp_1-associated